MPAFSSSSANFIAPIVPIVPITSVETTFARRLIAWQREHGRHDLPWQNTHDPYRIWLSEIMLQQTQVSTVIPYYERFLDRFPDVAALAAAPLDEVMALWAGLGYYSRARNLHRCARMVVEQYDGAFPNTAAALAELCGIGRSTAAAIAAFAFGARAAILDGNVKRVLARVFGVEGFPGNKRVEDEMWRLAESLLPNSRADMLAYTQGLMDLGATLCIRGKPQCVRCPFAGDCVANLSGRQRELPTARPKKVIPTRRAWMLVLLDEMSDRGASVLLEKRPPAGIWGGLWCLPQAADAASLAARAHAWGCIGELEHLAAFTHTFTHFKLDIHPCVARVVSLSPATPVEAKEEQIVWAAFAQIEAYGVPAPVRKLLASLRA